MSLALLHYIFWSVRGKFIHVDTYTHKIPIGLTEWGEHGAGGWWAKAEVNFNSVTADVIKTTSSSSLISH